MKRIMLIDNADIEDAVFIYDDKEYKLPEILDSLWRENFRLKELYMEQQDIIEKYATSRQSEGANERSTGHQA